MAVVFEVPDRLWPVELYVDVPPTAARPLWGRLKAEPIDNLAFDQADWKWVLSTTDDGYWGELAAHLSAAPALGKFLHYYLEACDQSGCPCTTEPEVVIRQPVPPSAIVRLVAMSETNAKAEQRRYREQRDRWSVK